MTAPHVADRWDSAYHAPAMVAEVLRYLAGARRVLDGTLGGGGHAAALLDAGSRVAALDRDPEAIAAARARLAAAESEGRFRAFRASYAALDDTPLAGERFDGILLDLGVSSHQIDDVARGFSFREGAALDMRMDPDDPGTGATAADLLNTLGERDLVRIFREDADEPKAGALAREIIRRRERRPFATSNDLVDAIRGALGPRSGPPDFARLFQAVRIAVNEELAGLERALPILRDHLESGGALVVIAYHSGEDRAVKRAFREWSAACICPPRQPICTCRGQPLGETLTRKPVSAGAEEVGRNPRARSAHLRVWRRAE